MWHVLGLLCIFCIFSTYFQHDHDIRSSKDRGLHDETPKSPTSTTTASTHVTEELTEAMMWACGHDMFTMWIHDVDDVDMTWPSVWKHDVDRSTIMWKHVRLPTSDTETHCPSMCVSMSDVVMAMSVSVFFVTNSRIDSRDSDVLMIDFCFNRKICKKGCSTWSISKHFQAHFETRDNVTMWQQWTGRHSVKPWNHGTLGWSILYKMPAKSHRLQSLHASTYHRHSSSLYTVLIFLILIPDFTRCFFLGLLVKTHRFSYVKAWAHSFFCWRFPTQQP